MARGREHLEELLSGYVDGALTAAERARVEAWLAKDESARRLLRELQQTAGALRGLPRHAAPPTLLEDVTRVVERGELLGETARVSRQRPRRIGLAIFRWPIAAVIALAVLGGTWWLIGEQGTSPRSKLAQIETQRSSNEQAAKPTESRRESDALSSARSARPSRTRSRDEATAAKEGMNESFADAGREKELRRPAASAKLESNSGAELLARANFDQKRAIGVPATTLREHAFANEPVRLQVNVGSAAERDAVAARLAGQFAAGGVQNLSALNGTSGPETGQTEQLYYEGRAGVNFAQPMQRQMLVRAPVRLVQNFVQDMATTANGEPDVSLKVASVSIDGLARVQSFLNEADEDVQDTGSFAAIAEEAADGQDDQSTGSAEFDVIGKLAQSLGVSPPGFRGDRPPESPEGVANGGRAYAPGPDREAEAKTARRQSLVERRLEEISPRDRTADADAVPSSSPAAEMKTPVQGAAEMRSIPEATGPTVKDELAAKEIQKPSAKSDKVLTLVVEINVDPKKMEEHRTRDSGSRRPGQEPGPPSERPR